MRRKAGQSKGFVQAQRNKDLGAIHIAAKDLGLDDDTYRAMLWSIARVQSARDLDAAGRRAVLDHLRARGWRPARGGAAPDRPHNLHSEDRGPLLRKIGAQLSASKLPWNYGHALAGRLTGKDRLEFCSAAELGKVVAALSYHQRRRAAPR